jgi:hypothetical protein
MLLGLVYRGKLIKNQRQLNELGGVKPLAFGQYGELGPGLRQIKASQKIEFSLVPLRNP